jgi:hypothetical protein
LFHDFVNWIQEDLGRFKSVEDGGQSWSQQLHESLFMWNVIEGTHVLTIMFFAGTIWLIDLRMMGLAFTKLPFSKLNDRVLPITTVAFAAMVITGIVAFVGRDPLLYYHNIWFRLKMVFLVIAVINIFWFHHKVQNSQAEWDNPPDPKPAALPWGKAGLPLALAVASIVAAVAAVVLHFQFDGTLVLMLLACTLALITSLVWTLQVRMPSYPPFKVRLSGAISLTCWLLVIIFGRFIAYDWFNCEKAPPGGVAYFMEECDVKLKYLDDVVDDPANRGEAPAEETPADAAPADGAAPAEGAAPTEPATPAEPAPVQPAAPAQPTPGNGG